MPVLVLNSVQDTQLWKRLNNFSGEDKPLTDKLAQRLTDICEKAEERMKGFASQHPQYTLHDATHLRRVAELMWHVMPQDVAESLNPVEITLLILAAFFHDQGMVLDADERAQLDKKPEFRIHQGNWENDHPNLRDVKARLRDQQLTDAEVEAFTRTKGELEAASLTDFVRHTHGERSAEIVRKHRNDSQWKIAGRNVSGLVARLCHSHVLSASELKSDRFRVDENVGTYRVNMRYLGLVLRLADILDFDRDRAPHPLFRTLEFRSKVSLTEWAKHRSVEGWTIEPNQVHFTMECEHPEYERAARQFMDWIDEELAAAHEIVREFPADVARYDLKLPNAVDRSRIGPKDNAYIYSDLEFSLSRDEIVKLLMTEQLYGSPSLCIRELVQNSMDALRHRSAIFHRDNGFDWPAGKVTMVHELDEHGHEVVRCTDNGIGMTRQIIERFLTRAGRSYYRSPEWEQERQSLREKGVDFDPCAQFGIGFMSCFMLGDRIKITTRRDNGAGKEAGEALVVEINGISSMIVIRKGDSNQAAGTTIEITGRKKPRFLDAKRDKVQLIKTLHAFVLNCEFPVEARCQLTEIKNVSMIPSGFVHPLTQLEASGITSILTVEQSLSELNSLLDGVMRASFLLSDEGILTLENNEAKWQIPKNPQTSIFFNKINSNKKMHYLAQQVALDGIFVAGDAGREGQRDINWNRRYILNNDISEDTSGLGISPSNFAYIIDNRGKLKPPLSPARSIANEFNDRRWDHLRHHLNLASAKIWEQIVTRPECKSNPGLLWILSFINHNYDSEFSLLYLPGIVVFEYVSLPIKSSKGDKSWIHLNDIGEVELAAFVEEKSDNYSEIRNNPFWVYLKDGSQLFFNKEVTSWLSIPRMGKVNLSHLLMDIVGVLCTLVLRRDVISFKIQEPTEPDAPLIKFLFSYRTDYVFHIPYAADAAQFISVHCPCISANRNHPLSREAVSHNFDLSPSRFGDLPEDLLWLMCHAENEEILLSREELLPRWVIEIAHRVLETEWGHDSGLAPPYKVRLMDGTSIEITRETFETWAKTEPLNDEEE